MSCLILHRQPTVYHYNHSCKQTDFTTGGEHPYTFLTPRLSYAFPFNTYCQFTLILNLSSIIFSFTPFGFLHTWTLNCGF